MIHQRMTTASDTSQLLSRLVRTAEYLDADTEMKLAKAWRDHRDEKALHRLVTAYLRLAGKMASKFRNYGHPIEDLFQEASIGLMRAAEGFDPDRGHRFSTYAAFWIRAQLQEVVLRNHSMVRIGTTSSQKALYFNLRRLQAQLTREAAAAGVDLTPDHLRQKVADQLGVSLGDVALMEGRLAGGDRSLNAPLGTEEDGSEWIEALEDEGVQAAERVETDHDREMLRQALVAALATLNDRERFVIQERRLREDPRTLESLGDELGISKERVRQIEALAFGKMKKNLETRSREVLAAFA